jgi:hypothetical protein
MYRIMDEALRHTDEPLIIKEEGNGNKRENISGSVARVVDAGGGAG